MDIRMVVELLSQLRQFRAHDRWTRQQLEEHQAAELMDTDPLPGSE